MAHARTRVVELDQERRRLGRGVVTGSIPDDLAREEQDRIRQELAQAQQVVATAEMIYARIEDTLSRALELVGWCDGVYRLGGPQVRRLSNQFFFDKLFIDEDDDGAPRVAGAVLREPWAIIVAKDFIQRMRHNTTNLRHDHLDGG
jgi:site-specific DNA recombinase